MFLMRFKNVPGRSAKRYIFCPNVVQSASITGQGTRGEPLCLPKPFPYKEKPFRWYNSFLDNTMLRVSEENAKLIIVEGPIGVGKSAFCKALAEQFDMLFIPQPTMDQMYVLPSGYDLRQHDHEVPECVQTYDHKNFCVNPKDNRAGQFQIDMMYLRFMQHLDGLIHLLNTGQGVILERGYYSDFVFMKAMYEQKFVSKAVNNAYFEIFKNTSTFLKPPHLIIYLDISVPVVQERIRTRNLSYEQNSPALTKGYLESLDRAWKQDYLKNASKNSEILVYNWTDGGDVEVVIDDIEKIDFDVLRRDNRFDHWRISRKDLVQLRRRYTNNKFGYEEYFRYPLYKVPEFDIPLEKKLKWIEILKRIPECKYDIGYNPHMGDSIFNILFKTEEQRRLDLNMHLRFYKDEIF